MKQIITFCIFLLPLLGLAQQKTLQLANQYFNNGEYEKASSLFEKLYKENPKQNYYFNKYIDCKLALEEYEESEALIKKQIKSSPKEVQLYVTYGNLLERLSRNDEAEIQFKAAIQQLPAERFLVVQLANAFMSLTKYELAIETYEKGKELLKEKADFSYYLADLYRRKGDHDKMIYNYLSSLENMPSRQNQIQSLFARFLSKDDYPILQTQLYERIQGKPNAIYYTELLAWVFIQSKQYDRALRQNQALDRRLQENGKRVFELAEIAANARDYETAIKGYSYILDQKGSNNAYFLEAKRKMLTTKRNRIFLNPNYSREDLLSLEAEYIDFLNLMGRNRNTALLIMELADLEALYLNDLDKAITFLQGLVEIADINKYVKANAKIKLADYYLMQGERWEATLLYSQVDKAFTDQLIGEEARFKNAKLSYFVGDFEWAQTQFDILKTSTSKLIANDALDLSIFILDNLGLDSTAHAMQLYADAEMLTFQNQNQQAVLKLDSIKALYPDHSLQDDIYYLQARIFSDQREYDKAISKYERIINDHSDEIRCDNSIFELAEIYDYHLGDKDKAQSLYEKLFIDFSNSTFAITARKRYRQLRGDDIQ